MALRYSESDAASAAQNRTSVLLNTTLQEIPGEKVKVEDLMQYFHRRSFGGVFFILAILCLIPGVSIFAGIVLIIPGLQMCVGFSMPLLPRFISQRLISVKRLRLFGIGLIPWVEKLELIVRPRWSVMSGKLFRQIIGLVVVVMACIVAIPFPLSNYPPAIAVLCLSLGLLERDGWMIMLGLVFSGLALFVGVTVFVFALEWVIRFFSGLSMVGWQAL